MLCSKRKECTWNLMCDNTNPVNCHLQLLRCSIPGPEEEKSESALPRSGIPAWSSHKHQSSPTHAYWCHNPIAYRLVTPSSQLIWRSHPWKVFSSLGKRDVTLSLLWFQLPCPLTRMVLCVLCLSPQLYNGQQGFLHNSSQSTLLGTCSLLLMFHSLGPSWQPNYFIFTTNYYFCLSNGNIFSLWWNVSSALTCFITMCLPLPCFTGRDTLGARECRCSKATQCLATPFLFEVTHNYRWFGSVTFLIHSLTN